MEPRELLARPDGTRGAWFQFQGEQPQGDTRSMGRAARLLYECVKCCLAGEKFATVGFYAACDGNYYETDSPIRSIRDYGPREFSSGFHSLWIYPSVNNLGATGPVLTFSDPDFGFLHACSAALRDLESRAVGNVFVAKMSLRSPRLPAEDNDELYGFVTGSESWLRQVVSHAREMSSGSGFKELFKL